MDKPSYDYDLKIFNYINKQQQHMVIWIIDEFLQICLFIDSCITSIKLGNIVLKMLKVWYKVNHLLP